MEGRQEVCLTEEGPETGGLPSEMLGIDGGRVEAQVSARICHTRPECTKHVRCTFLKVRETTVTFPYGNGKHDMIRIPESARDDSHIILESERI